MNIKMKNGNILGVLQDNSTVNGLYMPDDKAYKIIEVVKSEEGVEVGSTIYVPKRVGTAVTIEGKDYIVVNVREIILVV